MCKGGIVASKLGEEGGQPFAWKRETCDERRVSGEHIGEVLDHRVAKLGRYLEDPRIFNS